MPKEFKEVYEVDYKHCSVRGCPMFEDTHSTKCQKHQKYKKFDLVMAKSSRVEGMYILLAKVKIPCAQQSICWEPLDFTDKKIWDDAYMMPMWVAENIFSGERELLRQDGIGAIDKDEWQNIAYIAYDHAEWKLTNALNTLRLSDTFSGHKTNSRKSQVNIHIKKRKK